MSWCSRLHVLWVSTKKRAAAATSPLPMTSDLCYYTKTVYPDHVAAEIYWTGYL